MSRDSKSKRTIEQSAWSVGKKMDDVIKVLDDNMTELTNKQGMTIEKMNKVIGDLTKLLTDVDEVKELLKKK